jgi:hypothetical protein
MTTLRALVFAAMAAVTSASTVYAAPRSNAIDAMQARIAAAQTTKQQCMNNCRARYRDCRHQNQLPSSECQGIYQDCTRYTCTGLGPG